MNNIETIYEDYFGNSDDENSKTVEKQPNFPNSIVTNCESDNLSNITYKYLFGDSDDEESLEDSDLIERKYENKKIINNSNNIHDYSDKQNSKIPKSNLNDKKLRKILNPKRNKTVKSDKENNIINTKLENKSKDILSTFDNIIRKRKAENAMKRKLIKINKSNKRCSTEIDRIKCKIDELINEMKTAYEDDKELCRNNKSSFNQLELLDEVENMLTRSDHKDIKKILIESEILSAMALWLKPLKNHILPSFDIRMVFLQSLLEFDNLSMMEIKESGIDKAVLYLSKHKNETHENKNIAIRLINQWSKININIGLTKY